MALLSNKKKSPNKRNKYDVRSTKINKFFSVATKKANQECNNQGK